MQGTKGIHAAATSFAFIIILWLLWPYTNNILNTPADNLIKYIFWGSYLVIATITIGIIPYLIAQNSESDASFVSALKGLGTWGGAVILGLVTYPAFGVLISYISAITNNSYVGGQQPTVFLVNHMQNGNLIIQLISLIYILFTIITLYLVPLIISMNPSITEDLKEKLGGVLQS